MNNRMLNLLAAGALMLPASAHAHRQWLLPSATNLSGDTVWVTVDAAVSNDLFYFEHQPLRLTAMKAWAPDGSELPLQNATTGRYRSTFDVELKQKGTYKIGTQMNGATGTFKLNGEEWRVGGRGGPPPGAMPGATPPANVPKRVATPAEIPAGATDIKLTETISRNETFVTVGTPTDIVLKPSGKGLELAATTRPTDLVAGEPTRIGFVIDGKPAAGVKVEVVPGGIRYRTTLNEQNLVTDAAGEVAVNLAEPGFYWVEASAIDAKASVPNASERRLTYIATLEVAAP